VTHGSPPYTRTLSEDPLPDLLSQQVLSTTISASVRADTFQPELDEGARVTSTERRVIRPPRRGGIFLGGRDAEQPELVYRPPRRKRAPPWLPSSLSATRGLAPSSHSPGHSRLPLSRPSECVFLFHGVPEGNLQLTFITPACMVEMPVGVYIREMGRPVAVGRGV
jgi:hypothetical protein